MPDFDEINWNNLLPSFLVDGDKERLKGALKQFRIVDEEREKEIDYNDFFFLVPNDFFRQGDLIYEIRSSVWNEDNESFETRYTNAIILSNTCDISNGNERGINSKQCLFAPLLSLVDYINLLKENGIDGERLRTFLEALKNKSFSNLLYIPPNGNNNTEYIAYFDQIFWLPTANLNNRLEHINEEKIASLSHFGYYLFMLKLSYHLCRIPEDCDRETIAA